MNINELTQRTRRLEDDIASAVSKCIEEFEAEVGATPDSVYISMVEKTQINQVRRQYVVAGVQATIEL